MKLLQDKRAHVTSLSIPDSEQEAGPSLLTPSSLVV